VLESLVSGPLLMAFAKYEDLSMTSGSALRSPGCARLTGLAMATDLYHLEMFGGAKELCEIVQIWNQIR